MINRVRKKWLLKPNCASIQPGKIEYVCLFSLYVTELFRILLYGHPNQCLTPLYKDQMPRHKHTLLFASLSSFQGGTESGSDWLLVFSLEFGNKRECMLGCSAFQAYASIIVF